MRYLITGGSGFIGSHLATALLRQGDQVTVLDPRPGTVRGAVYVPGSVCNANVVGSLVAHHDAVFHLASVVGFAHLLQSPKKALLTMTLGTAEVLFWCAHYQKRVLLTSSSCVYGRATNGDTPVQETDDGILGPTSTPSWTYAYGKAADECLALAYHREDRLPVVVARLFNVVGPGQSAEAGFVLPRFVQRALRGDPLEVHRPGTQTRTFGHVFDIVAALSRLMVCEHAVGEVVNVGGTVTTSIAELARVVVEHTGSRSPIVVTDAPYAGYDNVLDRRPDLTKLRALIDYVPQHELHHMVSDVIADE